MQRLLFIPLFLTCLQLAAQVAVLDEKFDFHKLTYSVTLQNNYDRSIYLTGVNGKHRCERPIGMCGSSHGITVKSVAKYTFSECSKSPYVVNRDLGFEGYLDTVPREERLQITPLEIPPHGTQKFQIAFVIEFGTCSGFFYTGTVDLLFNTSYKFSKKVQFDFQGYYSAPVTQSEVVEEITKNAMTDAWYIRKMREFEWNKDEAAALISLFVDRINRDSARYEPSRYGVLRTDKKENDLDIIAETILMLRLESLYGLVGDFLEQSPDRALIHCLLAISTDEQKMIAGRQKIAQMLRKNVRSEDYWTARSAFELIADFEVVELKDDLLGLYRSGENEKLKDYVRFILERMGVNPGDK